MHGWLRTLRGHVEPNARSEGNISIFCEQVRIFEQFKFRIVRRLNENVRKLAIVVVPGELEGTAAEILNSGLVRPGGSRPALVFVVARGVISPIATNFLDPVQRLLPDWFRISCVIEACLLGPVSKNGRQFSLANLVNIGTRRSFSTEGRELGNGFQEVGVGV